MTLTPEAIAQLLMGGVLGLLGYLIRQVLSRLDRVEARQVENAGRLIRIETQLRLHEPSHYELREDEP